jgi:hypothetical protein
VRLRGEKFLKIPRFLPSSVGHALHILAVVRMPRLCPSPKILHTLGRRALSTTAPGPARVTLSLSLTTQDVRLAALLRRWNLQDGRRFRTHVIVDVAQRIVFRVTAKLLRRGTGAIVCLEPTRHPTRQHVGRGGRRSTWHYGGDRRWRVGGGRHTQLRDSQTHCMVQAAAAYRAYASCT